MGEDLEFAVSDPTKTKRRYFLGQRHVVTLIGFLNWFLLASNRLVLSISIVAMAKHMQGNETSKWNGNDTCPTPAEPPTPAVSSNFQGEFDWSSELQGYVLGAGFLSYIMTQTTAGRFADAVGCKPLMVYFSALTGILVILSPLAARWHVYALIAVQFLRGASQGITTPALYKVISNWIPRAERGALNSLVSCGYSAGAAINGIITGWLCDIPGLGWPSAFYIWGAFTIVIAIVTQFIFYEHPENNPWITDEELNHINDGLETKVSEKKFPTPWKKMFTSIPTYAYCYALLGHMWGINYFTTVHPTFVGTVLHYSMSENGLTSCLPIFTTTAAGLLFSLISHWMAKKNLMSLDRLRKTSTCTSAFGFSLCMAGILLAGCDAVVNILCFALSLFSLGIAVSGVLISGVDMAPTFAGSLMGVASTVAGIGSFLVPVFTGLLTKHNALSEWQTVFWLNLLVVGSSGLAYLIFGSADVQPWNYPDPQEATDETKIPADKTLKPQIEMREVLECHKF